MTGNELRSQAWIRPGMLQYAAGAGLGAAGYALNLVPADIAFGLSFVFGGYFAFLAVRLLDIGPAILAGAISGAAMYQLWGHPFASVVFALNIAFSAWMFRRVTRVPQIAEVVYWALFGVPLLWAGYRFGLGMNAASVNLVVVKQAMNTFLLSAFASATVYALIRVLQWSRRSSHLVRGRQFSLRGFITILIVAFTAIPLILSVVRATNQEQAQVELRAATLVDLGAAEMRSEFARVRAAYPLSFARAYRDGLVEGAPNLAAGTADAVFDAGAARYRWVDGKPGGEGRHFVIATVNLNDAPDATLRAARLWLPWTLVEREIEHVRSLVSVGVEPGYGRWPRHDVIPVSGDADAAAQTKAPAADAERRGIVLPDLPGKSLMQRWRAGAVFREVRFPEATDTPFVVHAGFAPQIGTLETSLFDTMLVATLLLFATPMLAWGLTSGLVKSFRSLPPRMAAVIDGRPEDATAERPASVFVEVSRIEDEMMRFSEAIAQERAAAVNYRNRLEDAMHASATIFYTMRLRTVEPAFNRHARPDFISRSVFEVLGYTVSEALEPDWFEGHIHPDDMAVLYEELDRRDEVLLREGRWRSALRLKNAEGQWRWMSSEMFLPPDAVVDADENTVEVIGVLTDITERKQAEEQMVHAARMADLGVMATGIAHELNQPLDIIKLAATNMAERVKDDDFTKEYVGAKLDLIVGQVMRAARITNHMRLFGRADKQPSTDIDVVGLLAEMSELLDSQMIGRNISLRLDLPEDRPVVSGQTNRLEQVLLNLIVNAMHQIEEMREGLPEGASRMASRITLRVRRAGDWVRIECADAAGGVDPRIADRLFEPFVTTRPEGKGTGLGLSVAFGIVTDMGGRLSVENRDGGATFTIELPAADAIAPQVEEAGYGE